MTDVKRLYLFVLAALNEPPFTPVVAYLVQLNDGTNILIDSGIPFPPPIPALTEGNMRPNIVEQLASLGLKPDDIDVLVCTHFDIDHVGMHRAFPNAQRVIQRAHYDAALTLERLNRWREWWEAPIEQFRFVEGDTELFPGLTLIETDGHVPGHQSVLVQLPETGAVLLAIDAVPVGEVFVADRSDFQRDVDPQQTLVSTQKLLEIAARDDALVIFGHDGMQWQSLRKAPEFYA